MSPLPMLGAAGVAAAAALSRQLVTWHFERDVARRLPRGPDGIVVGAGPLLLAGSPTHAVLLLHGFNDTPQSVRPLADALHARGWTVSVPLLTGHGRGLHAVEEGRLERWLDDARDGYAALRASCPHVAVVGFSMGGALAAILAAEQPELEALVLLAPYLGMPRGLEAQVALAWLAHLLVPYQRSRGGELSIRDPAADAASLNLEVVTAGMLVQLRRTARAGAEALPAIRAPTLYVQARDDNRIPAADAERHYGALSGTRARALHWLSGSGHVVTVDYRKADVAHLVLGWLEVHVGTAGDPAPFGADGGAA